MYGSRSDEDEPDEAAELRVFAPAKADEAPAPEPVPAQKLTEITHPIAKLDDEPSPNEISLDSLRPATAEQVAAYVEHLGTMMDESMLLRPYVRTGGRTRAEADLPIEALVIGVPSFDHTRMPPEHRQVHSLCTEPRSVAEVAAYSRLPIGAARVIIGDMLVIGLLVLCSNEVTAETPTMELMARVRAGLRNL